MGKIRLFISIISFVFFYMTYEYGLSIWSICMSSSSSPAINDDIDNMRLVSCLEIDDDINTMSFSSSLEYDVMILIILRMK